jgi:hypothetical protein
MLGSCQSCQKKQNASQNFENESSLYFFSCSDQGASFEIWKSVFLTLMLAYKKHFSWGRGGVY